MYPVHVYMYMYMHVLFGISFFHSWHLIIINALPVQTHWWCMLYIYVMTLLLLHTLYNGLSLMTQGLKARGNVESWLTNVEESMVVSLRKLTKAAIGDFEIRPRHEWATKHPSQVSGARTPLV